MTSRTIVGLIALAAPVVVGIYLLAQIPWEYAVFGILALGAILFALGVDEPDTL